ncbi:amidohydrolase family protein [Roseateles sp. NT4]|uniref:amidohydrolase family protein n=1 Tax=Roseateles sp. NT4 TaxID=3453715 RepID=UPI003EEA3A0A
MYRSSSFCGSWICTAFLAAISCCAQASGSATEFLAFVHVNVVSLAKDGVQPDQTVLVQKDRIVAVGPAVVVPKDARVIDGRGRAYLSPGLADMHVHSDTRADMAVYLANGVTSVLNMGEAANGFVGRTKPAANRGETPSPHIYTAFRVDGSPRYGSFVVKTPEEARWAMRLTKANGHDFIKVYNDLSAPCFEALIEESKKPEGLPVIGHGVEQIGLTRQLALGQLMVAHAEEFFYTVFTLESGLPPTCAPNSGQISRVVQMVAQSGAFVTADLQTYASIAAQWGKRGSVEALLRAPESRYLSPQDRLSWLREDYGDKQGSLADRSAFLAKFVKAMSDGGVPLITGTDAPAIPGLVPGFSLHDNLARLVEAGLSPQQAMIAASRTPGEFIRNAQPATVPFGVIVEGARADLLLTAANPLESIGTLKAPEAVVAAGRYYARAELDAMLKKVASSYQAAAAN